MPFHSTRSPPRREGSRRHFFVSVGGVSLVVAFCLRLSSAFPGKASAASVAPSLSRSEDWTTNDDDESPPESHRRSLRAAAFGEERTCGPRVFQRSGRDTKILNFFPQNCFLYLGFYVHFFSPSFSLSLCPYTTTHHFISRETPPREQRERERVKRESVDRR